MNKEAIYARIVEILQETFDIDPARITPEALRLPLKSGVLSFVQNVDKELRNGGKASTCGIHAGI